MFKQVVNLVEPIIPELTAFRRDLHSHPELSRQEHRTSERIRAALAKLPNLKVLPALTGTDVVAVLNADKPGRCIAIRADIDALPIQEQTGVEYQSTVPGVMHACGHDGHATVLLGTAMVLSRLADDIPGKVKFIFQPDEEDEGGGRRLCENGVLESPKVEGIVALHAWPSQPVGTISFSRSTVTAASSPFTIKVIGVGGHGAYPHRSVDPIVISAHIITALQTLVSRVVDPRDAAVVSVGQIRAGSADNVIPSEAEMAGTMRYLLPATGEKLHECFKRLVEQTAAAHGGWAEIKIHQGYPPLINNSVMVALIEGAVCDLFGQDHMVIENMPSMGVEDFAYYAERVPAAMFRMGIRPAHLSDYPHLHNPGFNFNDEALPIGIRMFCEIVRRFFGATN